jgi:hypothetical protein
MLRFKSGTESLSLKLSALLFLSFSGVFERVGRRLILVDDSTEAAFPLLAKNL